MPDLENTKFHGAGYDAEKDHTRLVGQLREVEKVMLDFKPHTLAEISARTGAPEASISAALRTLRNQHGYVVDKFRATEKGGTWLYQITAGGMGEHSRKPRKNKPVGDPTLWGAMMQAIYARANAPAEQLEAVRLRLNEATSAWLRDMVERVKRK